MILLKVEVDGEKSGIYCKKAISIARMIGKHYFYLNTGGLLLAKSVAAKIFLPNFADWQYLTYVEFNTTNANVHQTIWGNSEVIYPEYKYHQYVKVNQKNKNLKKF